MDEVQPAVLDAEVKRRLMLAAVEKIEDERLAEEAAVLIGEIVDPAGFSQNSTLPSSLRNRFDAVRLTRPA